MKDGEGLEREVFVGVKEVELNYIVKGVALSLQILLGCLRIRTRDHIHRLHVGVREERCVAPLVSAKEASYVLNQNTCTYSDFK